MKTLKKSLCLVLALVMLFGLCAISSSAWIDYSDANDISNDSFKEAVDVLDGIGVLAGYPDGTFLPKKEVTRAEAAKIIAYLMIGNGKQADALVAVKDPFDDVKAGHWAAGYIQYCIEKGVINGVGPVEGVGSNCFQPDEKVSGLAFAKMLLCVIGYGANNEYTGANWAINVAKDALQYGIFDDYLDGATNEPATREECALYAFNTLELRKVTYSALLGGYVENIAGGNATNNAESNKKATLAKDFKLEKVDSDDDAFYRLGGHHWEKDGDKISANYDGNGDLVGYWSTPVTGNQIYTALGSDTVKDVKNGKLDLNIYVDGAVVCEYSGKNAGTAVNYFIDNVVKSNTDDIDGTGYGVQTYVYSTDDEVRVVLINTYLAKVDKVTKESSTKDAKTTVKALGYLPTSVSAFGKTVSVKYTGAEFETDSFAKNDYVLVTITNKADEEFKGIDMAKAATVNATITKYTAANKDTKITTGGETYIKAENDYVLADMIKAGDLSKKNVDGKKYTSYLHEIDGATYIIGVDETSVGQDYAYVAQFGTVYETGKLNTEKKLTADVYLADGTHDIYYVNTDAYDEYDDLFTEKKFDETSNLLGNLWDEFYYYAAENLVDFLNGEHADADGVPAFTGLYTVEISGNEATLIPVQFKAIYENLKAGATYGDEIDSWSGNVVADAENYVFTETEPTDVYKGISALREGYMTDSTIYADNDTIFFYVTGEYDKKDFKVEVVTGIKNAYKTTGADQGLIEYYAELDGKFYAEVGLVTGDFDGKDTDNVYFFANNDVKDGDYALYENDGDWSYDLYVTDKDGKDVTLTFGTYSKSKANTKLGVSLERNNEWVVTDNDYIVAIDAADADELGSEYNKVYYVNPVDADEVTKDTLYISNADLDKDYYNGFVLSSDTAIIDLVDGHSTKKDNMIESLGDLADFINGKGDYTENENGASVAFAYDEDHNVSVIIVLAAN